MEKKVHTLPKSGTKSKKRKKVPGGANSANDKMEIIQHHRPPEIKEVDKTIFEYAIEFQDFLKEAWRVADGVHKNIADRVSEFKGEDWEYEKLVYKALLKSWRYQHDLFPVFVARKNLFSKIDLPQTKEYRAVMTQLHYQTSTIKSHLKKLEETHQKGEDRPGIQSPFKVIGKIQWTGTVAQLGYLFVGLESKRLIQKSASRYADIAAHFVDKSGKAISPENLRKYQDEIGIKSKDQIEAILGDPLLGT